MKIFEMKVFLLSLCVRCNNYFVFLLVTGYAIAGIVLGCMAFVVGMTVVAYKCYRRYSQSSGNEGQNRLSSAIKKGRNLPL